MKKNTALFYLAFILFCIALLCSHSSAATIYVDPAGDGDGLISEAMQQAQPGDIIFLQEGTFWVDDTITLPEGITLAGPGEVKLVDNVGWPAGKTMFSSSSDNIRIEGVTIDGNSQGNTEVPFGRGYYALFLFTNSNNVVFDGVTLEYGKSDGIIFRNGRNITVTNSTIHKMGHEGLYILYSDHVTFTNNEVFTRTNSACRIASGEHILIANNEIYSGDITSADGGGSTTGPGIQINIDAGQPADNIEICNNYIHDLRGSGIWLTSASTRGENVYIHNNIIKDVGGYSRDNGYSTAGITIFQFNNTVIENNVFDDTGIAAVRHSKAMDAAVSGQFNTIVRNNIIINVRDKITITAVPILNSYSRNHFFYVYNNDFYNNYDSFDGEAYYAENNYALNPQFSDSMYHLQEDSPLKGLGFNGADLGAYGSGSSVGLLDNCSYERPNEDLDNCTVEDPEEDEVNEDLDNGTVDYEDDHNSDIDNCTVEDPEEDEVNEDLDNSTAGYIDNSTAEHHRKSKGRGIGYAVVITPQEEIFVGSAELTKPTFRGKP